MSFIEVVLIVLISLVLGILVGVIAGFEWMFGVTLIFMFTFGIIAWSLSKSNEGGKT